MKKILGNGVDDPAGSADLLHIRAANLRDKQLGEGTTRAGELAGKANAVYAEVTLTGLTLTDVKVPHELGSTPVRVELVEARNAAGVVHAVAQPILQHKWNATTCRVAVSLLSGAGQAGTVLKFRVGGE